MPVIPIKRIPTFQSSLPRGERQIPDVRAAFHIIFQSSLPRGERPHNMTSKKRAKDFNPRSHEGSDYVAFGISSRLRISILAPTRGATITKAVYLNFGGFQSSLPRGERHDVFITSLRYYFISILAPTRGATENASVD